VAAHGLSDAQLETMLRDLRAQVSYPPVPDLAAAVGEQLRARPRRRREAWRLTLPRRVLAVAALVLAVLGGSVLGFSPTARRAVAEWLGLPGVRIRVGDEARAPSPLGRDLNLGRRVTLAGAAELAGFEVRFPGSLPQPDEVYYDSEPPGGRVTLLYRARDELPRITGTDVGLLLTQFRASIERDLIEKAVVGGGIVEPVKVNGNQGYWIGGDPHVVFFLDAYGFPMEETVRLSGHTLVWERGDVIVRLESSLSLEESLEIARSVR
jgi:hypothetical protein